MHPLGGILSCVCVHQPTHTHRSYCFLQPLLRMFLRSALKFSLTVALVVVLIASITTQPVNASVTRLNEHVFAKAIDKTGRHWIPTNVTNTFTQDDASVNAFTSASFSQTNFTWQWYDPTGKLYKTDSTTWGCKVGECEFYDTLPIAGTDAAIGLGTWRMDLTADGRLLYSDQFSITPVIHEEFNWIVRIHSNTTVTIELDETIHPFGQQWTERGFDTDSSYGLTNFSAHDLSGRTLLVTVKTTGNRIAFTVLFPETETSDYKYMLTYDATSAIQTASNGQRVFPWGWCTGVNPLPQNVTIYLPEDYRLVEVQGVQANMVQTSETEGSQVVAFSGVAPPGNPGCFNWRLVYAPVAATTQMTASQTATSLSSSTSVSSSEPFPSTSVYLVAVVGVVVLAVLVLVFLRRNRRSVP